MFSMYVHPVRLPTNCYASTSVEVIAVGNGKTSDKSDISLQLKYAHLEIIPFKDCGQLYPDTLAFGLYICATSAANDLQSVCGGDSGGPLITSSDNTLVGITAFITKSEIILTNLFYIFASDLFLIIFLICNKYSLKQ